MIEGEIYYTHWDNINWALLPWCQVQIYIRNNIHDLEHCNEVEHLG